MNLVRLYLFIFLLSLSRCTINENKKQKYFNSENNLIKASLLNNIDSILIKRANESVVKFDSVVSNDGCRKITKYYDRFENLKIQKIKENCLADLESTWGYTLFFDNNKDTILILSFDGLDNIINVKR